MIQDSVYSAISLLEFQAILAFCLAEQLSKGKSNLLSELSNFPSETSDFVSAISSAFAKFTNGSFSGVGADWTGEKWIWKIPLQFDDDLLNAALKQWGYQVTVRILSAASIEPWLVMEVLPFFDKPDVETLGISTKPVTVPLVKLVQLQEAVKNSDENENFLYGYENFPEELFKYKIESDLQGFWKIDLLEMIYDFATSVGRSYISRINEQ